MRKFAAFKSNLFKLIDKPSDFYFILICYFTTLIFFFPNLSFINSNSKGNKFIDRQIEEVFFQVDSAVYPEMMHEAKCTFRITVPLIGKLLHTSAAGLIYFQFVIYLLFLVILYRLLNRLIELKTISRLLVLSFCFTYVGKSFFYVTPFFDCYAYLFLVLTFYFSNPFVLFGLCIAAFFTDERAAIAILFSMLWHSKESIPDSLKGIFKFRPTLSSVSLLFGLLISLALRFFLTEKYNVQVTWSMVGISALINNKNFIPFVSLLAFEGFWWLLIMNFFTSKKILTLLNFSLVALIFIGTFIVYDLTRSITYGFPAIFISLYIFKNDFSVNALKSISLLILASCILIPTYSVINPSISFLSPVFTTIFDFLN